MHAPYATVGIFGRDFASSRLAAIAAFAATLAYGMALAVFKAVPLNDALVFSGLLIAVVALLEQCPGRARTLSLHLIVQLIVLAWVANLWTLGYEGRSAVFGGILPWSDSFGFLNDALRLDYGHPLDMSAKRPIFPTALAGLLRLFNGDLRLALLAFGGLAAWSVALTANAVWRTHGPRAALVVLAILLFSARHWAGVVQTEDVGLPLGLIGFVAIWRAAAASGNDPAGSRRLVLAGLFAITVALMARAGAFFVLPAIAVWSALYLVPSATPRAKLGQLAAALLAIAAGATVHEIVLQVAADGMSFADYPAIVFGLIHHQDFTLLTLKHPELAALSGAARAAASWRIVLAEISLHPGLLVIGLLRSFAELFYTPNGLFGFVWRNPDDIVLENGAAVRTAMAQHGLIGPLLLWIAQRGVYSLINAVAMALLALGWVVATIAAMIALFRRPADRFTTLLRWVIGGVLVSAPFTPPWITQSHQVQTATLAFLAVTTALWRRPPGYPLHRAGAAGLVWLPAGFGAAVILAAVVAMTWPQAAPANAMRIYPSTLVRVVPVRSLDLSLKRDADLWASTQYLKKHNGRFTASLVPYLRPGTVYVLAFDSSSDNAKILIDEGARLNLYGGWQKVEAQPLAEPAVERVIAAQPWDLGKAAHP